MNISFITRELHELRAHFNQHGFDLRLVGGGVRDTLAGVKPKDIDLATDATPNQQIEIYNSHNYRWIGTGVEHGTVTVVLNGEPHEITSLRVDVKTDGRHAEVAFTNNWELDAARRDFTINSMSLSFDGKLFDPFGGEEDLKNSVVRFVGNAEDRIKEDYLRILRFFRFVGRFGNCQIDDSTNRAILKNAEGLQNISRERIWSEFQKILPQDHSPNLMAHLLQRCIFRNITEMTAPYIEEWPYFNVLRNALKVTKNPELLMAAACNFKSAAIDVIAINWRWSNVDKDHALWICNHINQSCDLRRLIAIDNAPREWVIELAALENRDSWEQNALAQWVFEPFPVNGNDLMALGIKPGFAMGVMLSQLKEDWGQSGFSATKEELLDIVARII